MFGLRDGGGLGLAEPHIQDCREVLGEILEEGEEHHELLPPGDSENSASSCERRNDSSTRAKTVLPASRWSPPPGQWLTRSPRPGELKGYHLQCPPLQLQKAKEVKGFLGLNLK